MRPSDERVIVLAPSAHDGPITAGMLSRAGFECVVVADVAELCRTIEGGAAAALVAQEALGPAAVRPFTKLLESQEPWSDLPVVLFTARGVPVRSPVVELVASWNVTLLERPVDAITLVSAVRSALRARRRQYAARAVLVELQAVLDAVPAAVWIARDPRGDLIDANRLGAELLRTPPRVNVSVTASGDGRPRHFTVQRQGRLLEGDELPVQRAARLGVEIRDSEIEVVFDDGEVRHLLGNAAPLRSAHGAVKGSVGAFIDITERRLAEEAVRDSDRRKSEFLALLSHELRNPLASISNSVLLLTKARDGAVADRAVEILRRQTRQLSRLVDDLLDISRIAHGKIQLELERLDAREIVRRAYLDAKDLFDERGVELLVAEPTQPLWVEADAARFTQMVGNLLNNSLKFTAPGGKVELRAVRRGAACEVSVRDTGQGIEPAELERIFELYAQVERTRRGQGGLGLGLALVRELARKQGGSVRAASAGPGKGAEFVIQLPLTTSQPQAAGPSAGERQPGGLSILIVEDNEDGAATLAALLELLGHSTRVAGTGRAAIEEVGRAAFDALICDIGLPDMSGHQVIGAIRSLPQGRSVFAVALTGYAQPRDRDQALAAGFDDHLAKPPPMARLQEVLEEAARRAASRRPSATEASPPEG